MGRAKFYVFCIFAGGLSACDGAERAVQRTDAHGEVTLAGRAHHADTLVTAWPTGSTTVTNGSGRFHLFDVAIPGLRFVFEHPGYAVEEVPAPRGFEPFELYRGHRLALPEGFVPVESEPVPPRGALLRAADGASVLVDLADEQVRLHMPPGWTPFTDGEGWFVGVDELSGDVEALNVDGRVFGSQDGGWRPERVIRVGPTQNPNGTSRLRVDSGVLLTRPWDGRIDRLQVAFWPPRGDPSVFPDPVVQVGPVVREGAVESVALVIDRGVRLWQPGQPPRALVSMAPSERMVLLDMPEGQATTLLCYGRGRGDERRIECVGPRFPRRRLAVVGEARASMLAVDPPTVAWQPPGSDGCQVRMIGPRGVMGEEQGPFGCDDPALPAWRSGHALILWLPDGAIYRLTPDHAEPLGESPALDVSEGGLVAFLDQGQLLTVVRPDERVLIAPVETSADTVVRALPDGAVALDGAAGRLVWVATTGGSRVVDLTDEQARLGVAADQVFSHPTGLLFAGESGVLRVDLERGTARALAHRGWSWVAVGHTEPGRLPDVALARSLDLFQAVDLLTGRVDVLGRGNAGGVHEGRPWFAGPRGLYLVDDRGALP